MGYLEADLSERASPPAWSGRGHRTLFSEASNYEKAAIGRTAAKAIEQGADPSTAIAEMDAAWQRTIEAKRWD